MVGELAEPSSDVAAALGLGAVGQVSPADEQAVATAGTGAPLLEVSGLVVHNDQGVAALHGVDLSVGAGEVLGVAGVAGNGQVELAEALAGVRPAHEGDVRVDGAGLAGRPTRQWLGAGVAYVPEDRHRDGILPSASIIENLVLGAQRGTRFRKGPLLDWSTARKHAEESISRFSIKTPSASLPAAQLSGGNIQRVILARAFSHRPGFLILHNPTRGLDIPSTQFVYERAREAVEKGSAVLLISEDLDELTGLCDRLLVIYSGRIVGERLKGNYDQYELGHLMAGLEEPT
jgi:simple sugar transport system ATP-binding protein